ncbi:MAG: hypothetical protein ACREFA_20365, partial [Stellaceae bacterium]
MAGWSGGGRAQDIHAAYSATWAGLPAAGVRLILHDGATRYDDRIAIATRGLPRLFTRFRGSATAKGRIGTRRFDVVGRVLSRSRGTPGTLRLDLILRPIAGFKNRPGAEDPENAPRTVELLVTDDGRALPL